jgi:hypothetical protein
MQPFGFTIIRSHASRTCRAGAPVLYDSAWFVGPELNPYIC